MSKESNPAYNIPSTGADRIKSAIAANSKDADARNAAVLADARRAWNTPNKVTRSAPVMRTTSSED